MAKYLEFVEDEFYKGKTKVFQIYHNETEELLGEIKWHSGWRQYCFYPEEETHWSRGCLQEIQEFIYKLMCERQEQKKDLEKNQ